MKNGARIVLAVASSFVCASLTAAEVPKLAHIEAMAGKVMIYDGTRYSAAEPGMSLAENSQVLTLANSQAKVVFQEGCAATLEENAALTIPAASVHVCANGKFVKSDSPLTEVHATFVEQNKNWMIPAAIGAGVLIVALVASNDDDDNDKQPVSFQ